MSVKHDFGKHAQPHAHAHAANELLVHFHGVRGTIACPGGEYIRYGGNTSCIEIRCGNKTLFTDPWLTGPAFVRGWWLVHQPPSDWLERIVNADASAPGSSSGSIPAT